MHRQGERHQRLVAIFVLGLVLLLPPLLLVFNRPAIVLGVPILHLYLFCAWAWLIALGAIATWKLDWGASAMPRNGAAASGVPRASPSESETADA